MKFRITMKDPDGPYECIHNEAEKQVATIEGLDENEREAIVETRRDKLEEFVADAKARRQSL